MNARNNTIYVAGPMRGYDNWNYDAFHEKTKLLEESGWNVINPAELDSHHTNSLDASPFDFNPDGNTQHQDHLREILLRDLKCICEECGAIYMLSGWSESRGAKAEWALAKALGLEIFYEIPMPGYGHET